LEDAFAGRRQALQERRGVLVATVLRPEEREDRELEVIRIAAQQLDDARELPIGETECPVERLFDELRQREECSRAVRRPCRASVPS
jgi:hypothetical protein